MDETPFVRAAGCGETVICLHSSASSGSQWRSLMDRLSTRWRVLSPDLHGYGKSARAEGLAGLSLDDELRWLTPVFEQAGEQFHVVGHSYGGLLALLATLRLPSRVRSLVVYEPAAWSIAVDADPSHPGAREIDGLRSGTIELVEAGQLAAAAENFIRYWAGSRVWEAMPEDRKGTAAQAMVKVRGEFIAEILAHDAGQSTSGAFSAVAQPVLYLTGSESPLPARRVAEVLAPAFVNGRRVDLAGLGHMGPVTHPDLVNREVEAFLASRAQTGGVSPEEAVR